MRHASRRAPSLPQPPADERVHLVGLRRAGVLAGADGPDGLVRDDDAPRFDGQRRRGRHRSARSHGERLAGLALGERLADADDRERARRDRGAQPSGDELVGLAEYWRRSLWPTMTCVTPALLEERRAHFAGERAARRFGWRFCAASRTLDLSSVSATAASAVKGGATTTSTSGRSFAKVTHPCASSTLVRPPWNIFQLPAMRGRREGFMGERADVSTTARAFANVAGPRCQEASFLR